MKNLDLPSPGSSEDDAFGNLAAVSEIPADLREGVTRYVAGKLDALARETAAHRFEREIGAKRWQHIFSSSDLDLGARYIRNRLSDWELWHDTLAAFLNAHPRAQESSLMELDGELQSLLEDLADRFPRRANVEYDWGNYHRLFLPLLLQAATNRTEAHHLWRDWLRRWLRQNWGKLSKPSGALGGLAAIVFGPDEYREILGLASPDDLVDLREWSSEVFRRLADFAPVGVAEILAGWWGDRSFEETEWTWAKKEEWERGRQLKELIPLLDPHALERLALQLGLTIGLVLAKLSLLLAKQGPPVTDESPEVAREIENIGLTAMTELPEALRSQSRLWRDLQILAKYEKESYRRGTELLGLRTSVMETAATRPAEWARALPWILECSQHLGGLAEAITVMLVQEAKEVAGAVEALAAAQVPGEVRDRARGLQALAYGLLDPSDRLRQNLLSFAARQEVLVVPGKSLSALAPVRAWVRRAHPAASFYLSYFNLRSAAIPLSHFLIDLLVGLWLGTTDSRALEFAKGNARATVPRFIVEVTVDLAGEGHG